MQKRQQPMSRSRSRDGLFDLPLTELPSNLPTAATSAADPIITTQSGGFEDECVVYRWPQVALDGHAAIPVIEPDAGSRRYIARTLQRAGYKVATFVEPQAAMRALAQHQYDVAVLSGRRQELLWCAAVRDVRPELPVLFVLQDGDSDTVARVVDSGVDCLEAPFLESDLIARTGLLFRLVWRQYGLAIPDGESALRLDLRQPHAHVRGREIALTEVEYRTLWVLALGRGGVSRFCDIERSVWGDSTEARRIALRRVIHSLRLKMTGCLDDQLLLKTERCVGYRLLLG